MPVLRHLVRSRDLVALQARETIMSMEPAPETSVPGLQSRRSLFGIAASGGLTVLLAGCATPMRGTAVPMDRTTQASVLGVPNGKRLVIAVAKEAQSGVRAARLEYGRLRV